MNSHLAKTMMPWANTKTAPMSLRQLFDVASSIGIIRINDGVFIRPNEYIAEIMFTNKNGSRIYAKSGGAVSTPEEAVNKAIEEAYRLGA